MKVKDGYLLREVAGNYIIVAIGDEAVDFDGIITVNELGAFIWKILEEDTETENIVAKILEEYDVSEDVVKDDVEKFIDKLKKAELLV